MAKVKEKSAPQPPQTAAAPEAPHVHIHGPPSPYIVFVDTEGIPHFMEFNGVHLYCMRGRHHVQDRFGRHYEVTGAYDIMDPAPALHSYNIMCAAVQAANQANDKKGFA